MVLRKAHRARVITSERKLRPASRGSERERPRSKEGNIIRRDARLSNENVALRRELEQAVNVNQVLYPQASLHVGGLTENEQAARDELIRVRAASYVR